MMFYHMVLQVLPGAVLRPTQLTGFPGPARVKLLMSRQHAPVKETFVTIVTGEPRWHSCGVTEGRPPSTSLHVE